MLLAAASVAASLSGCSWFQRPAPVVQTRYKSAPYPYMSVKQTEVFIACRIALGGNDRRRAKLGKVKVATLRSKCIDDFYMLEDWWAIFVKLSDVYDRLDVK